LLMESLGLDYTLLGSDEWCCGNPLFVSGAPQLAERLIENNVENIQRLGVREVVTTCPGCYRSLKKNYPEFLGDDLPFEVLHSSELLARLLDSGKLR
ncbi:MAG: hypothetical protein GTN80_08435, partial [Nitrososphaeria archaeon]|nr:hypothetical protein [Nitrososphaeria archaeon]NIN53065.1 hypothetical protein [Nitrososphaeria archaeon]NIQ33649.1 hypothetical protein [Nitrososphaeria archaeon]